jgi:hypothetical protein
MRVASCLVLFLCSLAQADEIEDASYALAVKIASHLSPQERARLSVRNISSLPATDATRAQGKLEAALSRHVRTNRVITVSLTFSENAAGYLWVAEIHKGEVEMIAVSNPALPAPSARQLLTKRLLWEQREMILDVVQQADRTVILGDGIVAVVQGEKRSDLVLDIPRLRDPRGRLEVDGNFLTAYFPGATCRGTEEPLHLDCDDSSSEFLLNNSKVRFVPGRNAIAGVQSGHESASVCGGMKLTVVKENVIALASQNGAIRDQTELPGEVRELWPSNDGAVIVIRNPETDQYAAYAISVDCGSR